MCRVAKSGYDAVGVLHILDLLLLVIQCLTSVEASDSQLSCLFSQSAMEEDTWTRKLEQAHPRAHDAHDAHASSHWASPRRRRRAFTNPKRRSASVSLDDFLSGETVSVDERATSAGKNGSSCTAIGRHALTRVPASHWAA